MLAAAAGRHGGGGPASAGCGAGQIAETARNVPAVRAAPRRSSAPARQPTSARSPRRCRGAATATGPAPDAPLSVRIFNQTPGPSRSRRHGTLQVDRDGRRERGVDRHASLGLVGRAGGSPVAVRSARRRRRRSRRPARRPIGSGAPPPRPSTRRAESPAPPPHRRSGRQDPGPVRLRRSLTPASRPVPRAHRPDAAAARRATPST